MRRALLFLYFTLTSIISFAQNLVPNPSFEDTLQCPNFVSQIDYATGWHTLVFTPDYYNVCNNTSQINAGIVGVPVNARGYQPARTGQAYAGEVNYYTAQTDYRETFYAQLLSPLSAGVVYDVGMWVVMNEDRAQWAVDGDLGIYLSNSIVNPAVLFTYTPQISNPHGNVLNDSLNWTKISGTYTATGGEQYITIGSFIRDNQLTIINRGGSVPFTSYAIDDVWVIPANAPPVSNFISSDTLFCDESGKCLDFFDQSSSSPTGWQWLFPGATPNSSTQQNPTNICYNIPGTYPVTLIVTNTNGTDTLTVSPMITLGQAPAAPVIINSNDTLYCSSPAGFSFQWYFNGAPLGGATDSFYVATTVGNYAVRVTDSLGCSAISNGIIASAKGYGVPSSKYSVYPNPARDRLTVFGFQFTVGVAIEIYNILGEKVSSMQPETGNRKRETVLDVSTLAKGVYVIQVSAGDNVYRTKFIKD